MARLKTNLTMSIISSQIGYVISLECYTPVLVGEVTLNF